MRGITAFALNNSRTVIMAILLVIVGGTYAFFKLPKLEDPFITIREALVVAKFPGMPVLQVERLITRPIEEKIRSMGEVDKIKDSTSKVGECLIHVTIKDEVPSEQLPATWKLLRNRMADVKPDLPEGTIGPMVDDTFGDTSVATIALWSDGFSMAEMHETAREIRERLNLMKGIQKIDLTGVQDERIYLDVSNAKITQLGIDPTDIGKSLREQNIVLPAGRINVNDAEFIIETQGRFKTIEDIGDVLIPIAGTQASIPLRDITTVRRAYVEPINNPAYYNGHQAIVLSVFLLKGIDAVEFGERLKQKVKEIEDSLPWGYVLEFATYQPELIEKAVSSMVINVIESVAIVLVVVMLLLGLRTGLIVGSFIPLVMLFGMLSMYAFGIDMERMSLATMIIALGMFVDNAIVVSDDIKVNLETGMARKEAVLKTGRSLAVPLLTSTLTTVFAFGPILLQIGSTGDYTSSLGSVMIILLMGSWFFSMFSSTSMCFWFLKPKPAAGGDKQAAVDPYQGKFYRFYRRVLQLSLRYRTLVVLVAGGAFVAAVYALSHVPQSFFPGGDRNQYLIYVDLPAGTRIEETDRTVRRLSAWLQDKQENPEITSTIAYVANGGPRFFLSLAPVDPDPFVGFLIVNTENGDQVAELVQRTSLHIANHYPNVRGRVKAMWLGGSETGLFQLRLSGPDKEVLWEQSGQLMAALREIPGTIDIKQDWNNRVYTVMADVDQARARRAGVTSEAVANSLDFFIDGDTTTNFYEGNVEIPIVSRGVKLERNSPSSLRTLGIRTASGDSVPINQVADVYTLGELNRIMRYNQERTITVSAKNQVLKASEIFAALKPTLDGMGFPKNHYWELGGELEDSARAKRNLAKWLLPCFGGIIFLLVWQFNSIRRAAIIILTIPLVLVGAVVGLATMQADFGFMVILGLLALAGSIVNNGIVMIDKIEENRRDGQMPYDAVVNSAISRFRPILLSVSTTMLGFSPLIINRDPLFYGMACVMFFGLGIGSLFTLNYVPALYSIFFRVKSPDK
ncbi:MAG: efflux RND transporter permease subunit [Deltaproteobacteria bacterium]|jgi:multidrug efflux pump subunit AcrB|nr:efflux RND transporter permease subunit [Deltaproteobacteria bacterium]